MLIFAVSTPSIFIRAGRSCHCHVCPATEGRLSRASRHESFSLKGTVVPGLAAVAVVLCPSAVELCLRLVRERGLYFPQSERVVLTPNLFFGLQKTKVYFCSFSWIRVASKSWVVEMREEL